MATEIERFEYPSSSSDAVYVTVKWSDGSFSCNCPAWRFKRVGQERSCKHMVWAAAAGNEKALEEVVKVSAKLMKKISAPIDAEKVDAKRIAKLPAFFKPMMAHPSPDRKLWQDAHYIAEPKFDGQRALVFIRNSKSVCCYSREGNDLISSKASGVAWVKDVKWPFASAVLDAELCSASGLSRSGKDIQHARSTVGLELGLVVFDLLEIVGDDLKPFPWRVRRKQLEKALKTFKHKQIQITPVSYNPAALWAMWVEKMGGEGIMLKHQDAIYRPGHRSWQWLKFKRVMNVDVVITGVTDKATYSSEGYRTGEVALTYGYWDAKKKKAVAVGQGVKVGKQADLEKYIGCVAEMRCSGVMPSGALQHGHLIRFRNDKPATECEKPGEES